MTTLKRKAAIVGIAHLPFAKNIGTPERTNAMRVTMQALDDAGLRPEDVDGMVKSGLEATSEMEMCRGLGIGNLRFFCEMGYGGGQGCGAIAVAAAAVASGQADVVVCWRARNRGSGGRPWAKTGWRVGGDQQFYSPFGCVRPVDQVAMLARRLMHETGISSRDFAEVAVACRAHARNNPHALMRDPMTVDDHQASRPVSEPLRLLDCCLETDGALCAIVASADRARDARHKPAWILSAAQATGNQTVVMANFHKTPFLETPTKWVARDVLRGAGLEPGDLDCAQLYDAFTPLVTMTIEEFGFCAPGEAKDFVRDGRLLAPHGGLPINTSGGGLSEAYVHGYNLILEAVRQIRGTSTNQVPGCETCLVTSGAGVPTSAFVLGA